MKQILAFLLLFAVVFGCRSSRRYQPPGCVRLNPSLWIDEHPLDNLAYWEYLGWMIRAYGRFSPEYQSAFPDTSGHGALIRPFFEDSDTVLQHKTYFVPKAWFGDPLCCVSWQQLQRYNQWRTEVVYWLRLKNGNCEKASEEGLHAPHRLWDRLSEDDLKRLPRVPMYYLPDSLLAQARKAPQERVSRPLRTLCKMVDPVEYRRLRTTER